MLDRTARAHDGLRRRRHGLREIRYHLRGRCLAERAARNRAHGADERGGHVFRVASVLGTKIGIRARSFTFAVRDVDVVRVDRNAGRIPACADACDHAIAANLRDSVLSAERRVERTVGCDRKCVRRGTASLRQPDGDAIHDGMVVCRDHVDRVGVGARDVELRAARRERKRIGMQIDGDALARRQHRHARFTAVGDVRHAVVNCDCRRMRADSRALRSRAVAQHVERSREIVRRVDAPVRLRSDGDDVIARAHRRDASGRHVDREYGIHRRAGNEHGAIARPHRRPACITQRHDANHAPDPACSECVARAD